MNNELRNFIVASMSKLMRLIDDIEEDYLISDTAADLVRTEIGKFSSGLQEYEGMNEIFDSIWSEWRA